MKWTGSVRRIENPSQPKRIWAGRDYQINCSTDCGLDWIGNLPFPYFILEGSCYCHKAYNVLEDFCQKSLPTLFMKEVNK